MSRSICCIFLLFLLSFQNSSLRCNVNHSKKMDRLLIRNILPCTLYIGGLWNFLGQNRFDSYRSTCLGQILIYQFLADIRNIRLCSLDKLEKLSFLKGSNLLLCCIWCIAYLILKVLTLSTLRKQYCIACISCLMNCLDLCIRSSFVFWKYHHSN